MLGLAVADSKHNKKNRPLYDYNVLRASSMQLEPKFVQNDWIETMQGKTNP